MIPEKMEKQQHNIAFEESYWDDALAVLKREERKQRLRRLAVFSPLILFVFLGAIFFLFGNETSLKRSAKIMRTHGPSIIEQAQISSSPLAPTSETMSRKTDVSVQRNTTFSASSEPLVTDTKFTVNRNSEDKFVEQSSSNEKGVKDEAMTEFPTYEITFDASSKNIKVDKGSQKNNASSSILSVSKGESPKQEVRDLLHRPMQGLAFKGFDQSGRPGVKCQLRKANKRHEEFRKWSLQPQQWMLYFGNAFTKDYGSLGSPFAFNPQLGVAFEQHIGANTYFRIGAGVMQVSDVFAAQEYREVQASFGYEYHSTEIATQRLYLLDVPANLVYDFKLRHAVLAGVGMEYIGLTRNMVKTEVVNAFRREELSQTSDVGYLTGYTPLFWNAQIGYRYRFTRRASFDLTFTTGFTKIHESLNEGNTRVNARFNFNFR